MELLVKLVGLMIIYSMKNVLLGEDGAPFFESLKNKAYIIKGKSWVNNHAHVLREIEGIILNSFICNYLKSLIITDM